MGIPITPHLLDLVADAALKSFWRRKALAGFLRRCGIAESFLGGWTSDESKRDLLYRLFPQIEHSHHGPAVITKMAKSLAEQDSFPDLENWEDSAEKKRNASGPSSCGNWFAGCGLSLSGLVLRSSRVL